MNFDSGLTAGGDSGLTAGGEYRSAPRARVALEREVEAPQPYSWSPRGGASVRGLSLRTLSSVTRFALHLASLRFTPRA